ncbi:MAG TPA: hypothetical protein VKF63_01370, partial [Terracidiphilus sp.]|nr:hypothetical protein [Terracidiphilus sp.]
GGDLVGNLVGKYTDAAHSSLGYRRVREESRLKSGDSVVIGTKAGLEEVANMWRTMERQSSAPPKGTVKGQITDWNDAWSISCSLWPGNGFPVIVDANFLKTVPQP